VDEKKWLKVRNMQISNHGNFDTCFYVSAKEGHNVSNLIRYLKEQAQPGEWRFSPDVRTTLAMTDQLEQLIRGFLFTWFNKDVPYKIHQQTVGWTERLDGTLVIEHELIVKDSIVARMVLGTKARLIQRLKDNVVYKLKNIWNMDKITLLIHVKALEQRESKRDKIIKSKSADFSKFTSRGAGVSTY
jgi:GTP-binding protein Era